MKPLNQKQNYYSLVYKTPYSAINQIIFIKAPNRDEALKLVYDFERNKRYSYELTVYDIISFGDITKESFNTNTVESMYSNNLKFHK